MARIMGVALRVMGRPWKWGEADCCTAACDVFAELHGIDPMESIRGRYSTDLGAVRLVRRHGGWLALCEALAAHSGLVRGEGLPGEIGLHSAGERASLVICTSPGVWAGKSQTGMATVDSVVRCWRA